MVVSELIEKLQALEPNTPIVLQDDGPFVRLLTDDDLAKTHAAKSKQDETTAILTFDRFYKKYSDQYGEPFPVLLIW